MKTPCVHDRYDWHRLEEGGACPGGAVVTRDDVVRWLDIPWEVIQIELGKTFVVMAEHSATTQKVLRDAFSIALGVSDE